MPGVTHRDFPPAGKELTGKTRITAHTEWEPAFDEQDADITWNSIRDNPEAWWRMLSDVILNPSEQAPDLRLLEEMAERFGNEYQDRTPDAMLAPLLGEDRHRIIQIRAGVRRAVEAYEAQRFEESVRLLEELANLASEVDSEFDRIWIDMNRANALIWTSNWTEAAKILDSISMAAFDRDLKWLFARTLTVYGVHPNLSDGPQQLIERLREAIRIYDHIGA